MVYDPNEERKRGGREANNAEVQAKAADSLDEGGKAEGDCGIYRD